MAYASPRIPLPIMALPRLKTDIPNEVLPSNCNQWKPETCYIPRMHTGPVYELTSVKRGVFLSSVPDKNSWPSAFSVLFKLKTNKNALRQTHERKSTPGQLFSHRKGYCKDKNILYSWRTHTYLSVWVLLGTFSLQAVRRDHPSPSGCTK